MDQISRVYGRSLFEVAQERDVVSEVREQLGQIVEALSEAGGPTRLADLKKVKLTRKNADGETVTEEINVDAMWNRGGRDATPLRTDDVIFVPERII